MAATSRERTDNLFSYSLQLIASCGTSSPADVGGISGGMTAHVSSLNGLRNRVNGRTHLEKSGNTGRSIIKRRSFWVNQFNKKGVAEELRTRTMVGLKRLFNLNQTLNLY